MLYAARRAALHNNVQADATIAAAYEMFDRWKIGALSDQRYSEMLDTLLADLSLPFRAQSYYDDFLANGSHAELPVERPTRLAPVQGEFSVVERTPDDP